MTGLPISREEQCASLFRYCTTSMSPIEPDREETPLMPILITGFR